MAHIIWGNRTYPRQPVSNKIPNIFEPCQSCKISEATETEFEAKQGLNYVKPIHGDDGRLADGGVAPEYRQDGGDSKADNATDIVPEDIGDFYEQLDKGG